MINVNKIESSRTSLSVGSNLLFVRAIHHLLKKYINNEKKRY